MTRDRVLLVASIALFASVARGDGLLPPWSDPADIPLPTWAHSVAPKKADTLVAPSPDRADLRRATTLAGARLPLYGSRRGPNCEGRWFHVGPSSWVCSDYAELSPDEPGDPPAIASDGLPYRYFFVGKRGASGYANLARAGEEAPDEDLDPGFAIAVTEERTNKGQTWVHSRHATWISATDLGAARPSAFHGEDVTRGLDFAWNLRDRTNVYSAPSLGGKASRSLGRFEVVPFREEKPTGGVTMVRISEDGATPTEWVDARALTRATSSEPPKDVGEDERWVDIDLARQTLVAYVGPKPIFATLVSTGTGAPGTDTATHPGTFRVWVKLLSSTMDNLERPGKIDEAHPAAEGARYSMEDVPYVQFFDKAIALHGVFWHDDFGHKHSHGCVNLAPRDAARLFAFTEPHLTAGYAAILPSKLDPGTVVRVR